MATTFAFKLVTPTGVLFDGQAEQVNAVNPLGEFGVLADHTNYITSLVPGLLTIRTAEGQTLAVPGHGRTGRGQGRRDDGARANRRAAREDSADRRD